MLTEGRFAGACASLQEHWDAIYLATLGEEQDYLNLVTQSLSDAIARCDDEPWEDVRPFVVDADSRAHLYVTSFAWRQWQDSRT